MEPQINWSQTELEARGLTTKELNGRIQDILRMLPMLDEMDRTFQNNIGGYFRDVISVYRGEIEDRVATR